MNGTERDKTEMATEESNALWAANRLRIINESDAVCEGCGRDPRPEKSFHTNPNWFIDSTGISDDEEKAIVRCPECW